jgi:hypothetical protein
MWSCPSVSAKHAPACVAKRVFAPTIAGCTSYHVGSKAELASVVGLRDTSEMKQCLLDQGCPAPSTQLYICETPRQAHVAQAFSSCNSGFQSQLVHVACREVLELAVEYLDHIPPRFSICLTVCPLVDPCLEELVPHFAKRCQKLLVVFWAFRVLQEDLVCVHCNVHGLQMFVCLLPFLGPCRLPRFFDACLIVSLLQNGVRVFDISMHMLMSSSAAIVAEVDVQGRTILEDLQEHVRMSRVCHRKAPRLSHEWAIGFKVLDELALCAPRLSGLRATQD